MDQTPENLLEQLREVVDLGHKARNDSFLRQVSLACSSQGTPLPQAAGKSEGNTASGLMSLYRLLDNDQATLSDMNCAGGPKTFSGCSNQVTASMNRVSITRQSLRGSCHPHPCGDDHCQLVRPHSQVGRMDWSKKGSHRSHCPHARHTAVDGSS